MTHVHVKTNNKPDFKKSKMMELAGNDLKITVLNMVLLMFKKIEET